MKHLKQNIHRLVATTLLVCFCLSASSTVYAADPADWAEQLASFNKQLGAWGGSRDVSKNTWGYKIQLYSATENINFEPKTYPNKVGNGYCVKTIFALNTVGNPNVTYQAPAADQFRWAPLKLVTDMGALAIPEGKIEIVVWGGAAGTGRASALKTEGADPICEILGSPLAGGRDEKLDKKLRDGFNASEPFMQALLNACTNKGDGNESVLALDVYSRINDVALRQEIASKIPGGEANENFDVELQGYVLPDSPDCMISWAAYVTPLAHTKLKEGAEANALISDVFNDYMGTAHDYAYVNGATRAAATQLIETRDEIAKIHALDNTTFGGAGAATAVTQIEQSAIVKAVDANRGIIEEMAEKGEFGYQLYDVMYCALPNSVYNTKEMWGIPVGKPAVGYDDVGTAFGSGIGLLWQDNQHTIKKIEPCCRPLNWGSTDYPTAYCPCGGPGSPRCTCGCHCHPGHPCDCNPEIPEPVQENPLIDERHLIQQLEHEFPAKDSETVSMTYKPAPDTKDGFVRGEHVQGLSGGTVNGIFNNWPCTWYTCFVRPLKWETIKTPLAFSIPSDSYTLYSKMVNDPGSAGSKFALMQMDDKPLLRFDGGVEQFAVPMTQTVEQEDAKLGAHYQTALTARWLSHRWAIPGSENTAILAKYMAGTKNNQTYKEFMQKSGSSPVAEDNSYKNYNIPRTAKAPRFEMAFHIGDNEDLVVVPPNLVRPATYNPGLGVAINTGSELSLGIADGAPTPVEQNKHTLQCSAALVQVPPPVHEPNSIQSAILNKYECKTDVDVQQMYYGKTQAPNLGNYKVLTGNGPMSAHLESPSAVISFYPTYRMYADYNPDEPSPKGINEGNPVDMLGHIKRSFRYKEVLDVTCSFGGANVVAPWSRDQEDISTRTMKAGNAYKYSQGAVNITAEGTFYLLDPAFSDNPKQQQINDAIVKQHEDQIKAIGAGFSSGNIQLTSELYNSTAFSEKKPGSTGKEAITLESKDGYYNPPSAGRANLAGNEGDAFSKSPAGASVAGDANNALKLNLATGGGDKVQGWYNEDFEGIQKVTMTANFGVGPLSASYSSVHPHQSDWREQSKHYSISPIITVGSASWGAASIDNIQFHPGGAQFNVRGSVFDTVN